MDSTNVFSLSNYILLPPIFTLTVVVSLSVSRHPMCSVDCLPEGVLTLARSLLSVLSITIRKDMRLM